MTASAYPTRAAPRCSGVHISLNTPPVFVIGADAKKPQKNRVMRTVCISFAAAVAKEKTEATKYGAITADLRPYNSESGAQSNGPNPNPKIKRLTPRMPTPLATLNSRSIWRIPGA